MSKVLFISNYRDGQNNGYAKAGIDYILSLDAANVDVVPRAIKLINERVTEKEDERKKKDKENGIEKKEQFTDPPRCSGDSCNLLEEGTNLKVRVILDNQKII